MASARFPDECEIRYRRRYDMVRITLTSMTNHELREALIGLWSRLDEADRLDHINELLHYQNDPKAWLSPIARAIKEGPEGEKAIDLRELFRREMEGR